jgi:hypothetical protein
MGRGIYKVCVILGTLIICFAIISIGWVQLYMPMITVENYSLSSLASQLFQSPLVWIAVILITWGLWSLHRNRKIEKKEK